MNETQWKMCHAGLTLIFVLFAASVCLTQDDSVRRKQEELKNQQKQKVPKPAIPSKLKTRKKTVNPKSDVAVNSEKKLEKEPEKATVIEPPALTSAKPSETQPGKYGAIEIDLASLEADFSDDPELHIFVDGIALPKSAKSKTVFLIEGTPVGHRVIQVRHPMIEDFTYEVEIPQAGSLSRLSNPVFNIVRGKIIIETEPQAKIFIDGEYKTTADEEGYAEPVYLKLGELPHTIKIIKDGYKLFQDTQVYADRGEKYVSLHLMKNP